MLAMIVLTVAITNFSYAGNPNSTEVTGTILTVDAAGNTGTLLIDCGEDNCNELPTRFVLLPFGSIVVQPGVYIKGKLLPGGQERVVIIIDVQPGK